MPEYAYVGSELDLFAKARNWKRYLSDRIEPMLGSTVMEVGAGFGGTTRYLARGNHARWLCIEPDETLHSMLQTSIAKGELPRFCEAACGTMAGVASSEQFDSILYIDVLEHIEDDLGEVVAASRHLTEGGNLIVLCPAHQWLFTPFDASIGHHRRYNKRMMRQLGAAQLELLHVRYFDSVGLLASLANTLVLRQSMPTERQIGVWDRWMVPLSRWVDPWTLHRLGKSILAVWTFKP